MSGLGIIGAALAGALSGAGEGAAQGTMEQMKEDARLKEIQAQSEAAMRVHQANATFDQGLSIKYRQDMLAKADDMLNQMGDQAAAKPVLSADVASPIQASMSRVSVAPNIDASTKSAMLDELKSNADYQAQPGGLVAKQAVMNDPEMRARALDATGQYAEAKEIRTGTAAGARVDALNYKIDMIAQSKSEHDAVWQAIMSNRDSVNLAKIAAGGAGIKGSTRMQDAQILLDHGLVPNLTEGLRQVGKMADPAEIVRVASVLASNPGYRAKPDLDAKGNPIPNTGNAIRDAVPIWKELQNVTAAGPKQPDQNIVAFNGASVPYAKVPSGAVYYDPDGNKRTKR